MLISQVSEGNEGGEGEGRYKSVAEDHSHEYQTASELYNLMTKNNFDPNGDESLMKRDLVILYKNIDSGTKLITHSNEFNRKTPNQHVETIIYNEDQESDSDISEIYSSEDLHHVFTVNQERIDLLNDRQSFENTLCHKLGGLEIQSSNFTSDYDKHFLFKDPYIKQQLNSLNLMADCNVGNLFPASLLDYICCKRLEDNYNFYMENIIRYVKNTIEQLKRISNGDYLTDKAKEKWKELENNSDNFDNNTKILAMSTSIPLHVERITSGHRTTWDDIVHSEVDVRTLSKILEKKIVLEVPKLICGSYRIFSKHYTDNLIISCKRGKTPVIDDEKRENSCVDVVLQLQRSQVGQVISNISSIMILQSTPSLPRDLCVAKVLPLPYKAIEDTQDDLKENNNKIVELEHHCMEPVVKENIVIEDQQMPNEGSILDSSDYPYSDNDCDESLKNISNQDSSESSHLREFLLDKTKLQVYTDSHNHLTPGELRLTMQRLNRQSSLPEESGEDVSISTSKNKSPTRTRIKSPYENQSQNMEEKKRKKLLEIREKREKKKLALSENCKISKHKHVKGAMTPQPSSSVTKLSITNKSFYNSIYGQAINMDDRQSKGKVRKGQKKDAIPEDSFDRIQEENESPMMTPDGNSNKYINRSYYLDEAETEMMYMDMKKNENKEGRDTCSPSTSAVSNEFRADLTLLSQLIGQSVTDISSTMSYTNKWPGTDKIVCNDEKKVMHSKELISSQSIHSMVPLNTQTESAFPIDHDKDDSKKLSSSVACRKSIDKIYGLMKKLGKVSTSVSDRVDNIEGQDGSVAQGSDSGTSFKHHLTSSNPSSFSFEKANNAEASIHKSAVNKKTQPPTTVVPKVIISTKLPVRIDGDRSKKDRKRASVSPPKVVSENPLKAISQLLHEFDNVQKHRQKNVFDTKPKKVEITFADGKSSRQVSWKRKSPMDHHLKDNELDKLTKGFTSRERRPKPQLVADVLKPQQQPKFIEDKHVDMFTKKKIADIIDEAKEARGEAVRGPPKMNSRLNTLAQPKKSYVQAHSEEFKTRYGKNLMADRLQRLAGASPSLQERLVGSPNTRNRLKRSGSEAVSAPSARQPSHPVPPSEIAARLRRSASSSPDGKAASLAAASTKQNHVPDTPATLKTMVAVESYVKSHYGRASTSVLSSELSAHKSRVPFLPNDIELVSLASSPTAEESTELGSKLHRIIDSIIIKTDPASLNILSDTRETNSKVDTDFSITDDLSKGDERVSDCNVDVFEDKNILTVETANTIKKTQKNEIQDSADIIKYDIKPFNSSMELQKLENALYSQMSVGVFQKRLRLRNLTLTPKPSLQQVFLLQSGDAGSLVVKSKQNLKINKSVTGNLHDLNLLPVLSNTKMDWSFADFPMQIATVGYAFPKYQSVQCDLNSKDKSLNISKSGNSSIKNSNTNKTCQCSEDVHKIQQLKLQTPAAIQMYAAKPNVTDANDMVVPKVRKGVKQTNEFENTFEASDNKEKIVPENGKPNEQDTIAMSEKPSNTDHVNSTSSLDILVGLLNEIQKITKCHTNMSGGHDHKELENILNNAAVLEETPKSSPLDLVSITSLDNLRQLESTPSIYSLYLSNDEDQMINEKVHLTADMKINLCHKPFSVDKEVSADFVERGFVNRFTDVPSRFFPITMNHSTNVTNSLVGVISVPSGQSLFSLNDYKTLYSNSSFKPYNIIELPETQKIMATAKIPDTISITEKYEEKKSVENIPKVKPKSTAHITPSKMLLTSKYSVGSLDMDPVMKMKRDILVTVYSLLVFTVFAALSFPEMLYHV